MAGDDTKKKDIMLFRRYSFFCGLTMKTPKEDSQRVDDTEENLEKCICKLCPTFRENKACRLSSRCTLLRPGKIEDSLTNKNDEVLLSRV